MDNSKAQLDLSSSIEAILFYTAEPMTLKKLAMLTRTSIADIRDASEKLKERLELSGGGVRLLVHNDEIVLGTAPEVSSLIEQITRDEISKELSKASIETLSIICYKGPLTRSDIDYVRGVNSTFILRNLLIRGIIEKIDNPRDARAMLYGPTFAALEYMGVTKKEDLPQFEEIGAALQAFQDGRILDEGVELRVNTEADSETITRGDADGVALLCDTDSDGVMTEDECKDTSDYIVHPSEQTESSNAEANLAEENIIAPLYIDEELISHNEKDLNKD